MTSAVRTGHVSSTSIVPMRSSSLTARMVMAGQISMKASMLKAKIGRIDAGSPWLKTYRANRPPLTSMNRAATT